MGVAKSYKVLKQLCMQQLFSRISQKLEKVKILPKDSFGNVVLLKRVLIGALGAITYSRLNVYNNLKVEGTQYLKKLPQNQVLFLSNHQTYFADVIALYHVFCSVKWGFKNTVNFPVYLLAPRVTNYYVAAAETMKDSGIIPKIFSYAGAVTVERSWRAKGENVKRELDDSAGSKIRDALKSGWVVSFPQGTTKPFAPIRKGTAHIIKSDNPIVVPVVINGFRRAFDKKGLFYKKQGTQLSIAFKEPLQFSQSLSIDEILEEVRVLINQ